LGLCGEGVVDVGRGGGHRQWPEGRGGCGGVDRRECGTYWRGGDRAPTVHSAAWFSEGAVRLADTCHSACWGPSAYVSSLGSGGRYTHIPRRQQQRDCGRELVELRSFPGGCDRCWGGGGRVPGCGCSIGLALRCSLHLSGWEVAHGSFRALAVGAVLDGGAQSPQCSQCNGN